jgi:hypothetical protein
MAEVDLIHGLACEIQKDLERMRPRYNKCKLGRRITSTISQTNVVCHPFKDNPPTSLDVTLYSIAARRLQISEIDEIRGLGVSEYEHRLWVRSQPLHTRTVVLD